MLTNFKVFAKVKYQRSLKKEREGKIMSWLEEKRSKNMEEAERIVSLIFDRAISFCRSENSEFSSILKNLSEDDRERYMKMLSEYLRDDTYNFIDTWLLFAAEKISGIKDWQKLDRIDVSEWLGDKNIMQILDWPINATMNKTLELIIEEIKIINGLGDIEKEEDKIFLVLDKDSIEKILEMIKEDKDSLVIDEKISENGSVRSGIKRF